MSHDYSVVVPIASAREEADAREHHQASSEAGSFLDNLPMNRRHWTIFSVCAIAFMFDSLDFQVLGLVAPMLSKEWSLSPQALGVIFSATAFGMLVGTYLFGTLSDRIGRRAAFQLTVAIFAFASGACAFAQDATQLTVLRFLTGLGIGGFVPVDTAVMSEFMPSRRRGRMMALWAIFFPVGGLLAAWLASLIIPDLGWRAMFMIGVVPAVMVLVVRLVIPESPRFLLAKGRLAEARESIRWVAMGNIPDSLAVASPKPNKQQAHFSVFELFSPQYRQRTALLWGIWFFWSFSYFGIILWLPTLLAKYRGIPPGQVFMFIVGFMLAGIVGRIVVATLVDRVGRKPILVVCGVGAGALMLLFGQQTTLTGLMVFGYATAFFHDGGLSAIAPYTPELYPTRARATGVGWANGSGRIASILSPIVVGFLVVSGVEAVFTAFAAAYALCAVVMLVAGVETKGMYLEAAALETAEAP